MIKAILKGILKMITKLINTFLLPINAIFSNIFPGLTNIINAIVTFINTYLNVGGLLAYFFSLFPPVFRSILVVWFTFVVAYYGIYFTYKTAVKIWSIIQKIKFW